MHKRLFVLGFALVTLLYGGDEEAVTADSQPSHRILAGAELQRALIGNTLKGYDRNGPFWMYYPDSATIWGEASNGDVDIGKWWVRDGRYCRAWRRWFAGTTQCWTLALQGQDQIVWLGDRRQLVGATTLEHGNSIGRRATSQLAAAVTELQLDRIPTHSQLAASTGPDPSGVECG